MKQIIRKTSLYYLWRNWMVKRKQLKKLVEWERNGKPGPPPHIVKQRILQDYSQKFGLKVLVETGTFEGDMVEAMKNLFDKIYSIELLKENFEKAKKRFQRNRHIEIIWGDSGKELGKIMKIISQPALFWLDGHYSGKNTAKGEEITPIYRELEHIFSSRNLGHVIVIDDARCFGTDSNYPTIEALKKYIRSKRKNVQITVAEDSIRITPGHIDN